MSGEWGREDREAGGGMLLIPVLNRAIIEAHGFLWLYIAHSRQKEVLKYLGTSADSRNKSAWLAIAVAILSVVL